MVDNLLKYVYIFIGEFFAVARKEDFCIFTCFLNCFPGPGPRQLKEARPPEKEGQLDGLFHRKEDRCQNSRQAYKVEHLRQRVG